MRSSKQGKSKPAEPKKIAVDYRISHSKRPNGMIYKHPALDKVTKEDDDMELTEDEILMDDEFPDEAETLKEAWPLPIADTVKEFENYLMDIGVRI